SEDRRAAFEEAAGVMKYRVRKEEAERKLESTKKNLVRIQDILEELENQVGPLEEQSAAARDFLRLREELREIEVNVFLYQYDKLSEKLTALEETLSQLNGEIAAAATISEKLGQDCFAQEDKERRLNAAISDIQNKLLSMSSGAEAHMGSAKVLQERMANLVRERERLEADGAEQNRRATELRAQIEQTAKEAESAKEAQADSSACLTETEKKRIAMQADIEARETEVERQKNAMMEALNRLSDAKSRISRLEAIKTTILDRIAETEARQAEIRADGEKLAEEYGALDDHYSRLKRTYEQKQTARTAAIERVNEVQSEIKAAQEDLRRMEQQTQAAVSRIKVLEEMKRAYEGYYSSVKNLLRDAGRDAALGRRIEGVVAELVRVPKEYESAVEMALGSALQNIVTPTEEDAKLVIEHLRSRKYGRATFLPVSIMRARLLNEQERSYCQTDGFLGVASDLVGFAERYRGIFENLLGRTVLVRDLDAGIAINRRAKGAFRIATLQGDIINPGGSMTGGSTQKREFSLIGREREIEDLKKGLARLKAEAVEKASQAAALEEALTMANHALQEAGDAMHAQDLEVATQREKVEALRQYVDENRQAMERIELECAQLRDNIDNIDEQCTEAKQDQSSLEQGHVASQEDIRQMQAELAALRLEYQAVNEAATEARVALMAREKEAQAAQLALARMQREAETMERQAAAALQAAQTGAAQFLSLQKELFALGENIDVERKDIDALTDQLRAMEEERAHLLTVLDEMRESREKIGIDLGDLRERKHKTELNQNRSQLELANMQDRIWNDYELTYENAQPLRREIAITASHVRVDELKKDIRALGDVNVNAIENYRNVKERFDALNAQYSDLTQAEADLQVLIRDLVQTMEEEFKRQFTLIQQNFSTVFVELFGGGRAELVLGDERDILNCDIDIIAQPPGKKLQLLSLLSGGERALTAIALLFVILKLKPTAFCILDE
ncbi:MAG: chromosome segregation protein SMC, partial [Clostridia bacterium]|nr:chromosome segregation protein SMC [Clostridia bacterium]